MQPLNSYRATGKKKFRIPRLPKVSMPEINIKDILDSVVKISFIVCVMWIAYVFNGYIQYKLTERLTVSAEIRETFTPIISKIQDMEQDIQYLDAITPRPVFVTQRKQLYEIGNTGKFIYR